MNILYLRYAVEVAKAGSLNKAAEELFVAQPNLSRAIKELEKEHSITIFDRNFKGITLTPEGERFIERGKQILRELDLFEQEFKGENVKKSLFSVSVPRASYISRAFTEFCKCLSTEQVCEVYYKETNALRAINNILEKDYNLGVIRYAKQYDKYFKDLLESKNLCCELICEFKFVLLMNKESELCSLDEIHFSDLEDYIEISHADPYVPSVSLSKIKKEELPDNIKRRIFVFERASQFDVLSSDPETFMWVSPVPQETLERYGLVERICPDNNKEYRDVLIYSKNYKLSVLDKLFITELAKASRQIVKNKTF